MRRIAPMLALCLGLGCGGRAAADTELPPVLRQAGWEQRIGAQLPVDVELVDHAGARQRLGALLDHGPIVLAPVYFDCPMLCSLVLEGLTRGLKPLELAPGDDYQILAVSFDPGDTVEGAARSRRQALDRFGRSESQDGWHFLTGDEAAVRRLMEAIGFGYRFDEERQEYAHAAGIAIATPDGRVARYFFGVDYPARDLRLALVEASRGELGSIVDQVLLFCYRYDPETGRYSAAVMNIVRAGGALTVAAVFLTVLILRRRERRAGDRHPAQA